MSLVLNAGEQEAQNRWQTAERTRRVGRDFVIGGKDMYAIDPLADCDLVCRDEGA
jgi:hypothetical protein